MKKIIFTFLLIFLSTHSYAGKKMSVGISEWPPLMFTEKKPFRGISVDVMKEISNRLNLQIEIKHYPWSRIILMLQEGTLDYVITIFKNKEREKYILYSTTPYYTLTTVFYVQKGKKNLIQKYEDLYKIKVGVAADTEYFAPFNKDSRINKTNVVREIQLLKMLSKKRVDAIVGTYPQIKYSIIVNGYGDKFEQADYRPDNDAYLYIGCSRKSQFASKMGQISETIIQMKKEGKIQEIINEYFKMESGHANTLQ